MKDQRRLIRYRYQIDIINALKLENKALKLENEALKLEKEASKLEHEAFRTKSKKLIFIMMSITISIIAISVGIGSKGDGSADFLESGQAGIFTRMTQFEEWAKSIIKNDL